MSKVDRKSKILQGIEGKLSGENDVLVIQKNNVIRARTLKKGKSGQGK